MRRVSILFRIVPVLVHVVMIDRSAGEWDFDTQLVEAHFDAAEHLALDGPLLEGSRLD
jgi:hypothetical protein